MRQLLRDETWREEKTSTCYVIQQASMGLPPIFSGARSVYISAAYKKIKTYYDRGQRLLSHEEPDILRLKIAADNIEFQALPYVRDLQKMSIVPRIWISSIGRSCIKVVQDLRSCVDGLEQKGVDDTR